MAKVFSDAQNDALRSALRDMKSKKGLSQAELGAVLGIKQQNVGRLLRGDGDGFAYATATHLASALGYVGVDTFFRARGVAKASDESGSIAAADDVKSA